MTKTRQAKKKQASAMEGARKAAEAELKQVEWELAELEKLIKGSTPSVADITLTLENLDLQMEDYWRVQHVYLQHLLTAKEDQLYEDELKSKNALRKRRLKAGADANSIIASTATGGGSTSAGTGHSHGIADIYRINLPKREMQKFDGDVRNWRSFWASFTEIDTDVLIPAMEKYHYLLQAMVPGTRPHQVVKSYPPDGTSYALARDELKDKFGRDKIIIKVYIRDLMKHVIENSKDSRGDFTQMVTSLTAQIRTLEQLGVTQDNSGVILYPIVECCVPQEILNRYLQTPGVKEEIPELLEFLNKEVRRMDETALAQNSFDYKQTKSPNQQQRNGKGKESTPTAATFGNFQAKSSTADCGFCTGKHSTGECRRAVEWTLSERRDALKKNNCCFKCLRYGHGSRKCTSQVVCILCKQAHHTLMCWETNGRNSKDKTKTDVPDGNTTADNKEDKEQVAVKTPRTDSAAGTSTVGMANYVSKPEVLLQTLYVKMYGRSGSKIVRAVFDTCSQSSYIKRSTQDELNFSYIGKEKVIHQLFGAQFSEETEHDICRVEISGTHEPYTQRYHFQVSVNDEIAHKLIAPPQGAWKKECQERGIKITDIQGSDNDIELLIGNDISPYMKQSLRSLLLPCGLVATETRVGWVLEGKVKGSEARSATKAMVCINMQLSNLDVSKLWSLEAIGIKDSHETHSRKELEDAALDHFRSTVTQDETGRFEVHLPWIEGHLNLPQNKNAAIASLHRNTKKLLEDGRLGDYNDIFKSWLDEGIIEAVPPEEVSCSSGIIHYLPHRAVYKENSTTPTRPVFNASSRTKDTSSLNDCLEIGPNLLELIPSILTLFRLHLVGVVSDIRKAFLQIKVTRKHRDSMRFLWWKDVDTRKQVIELRHCRVVFGVSSSPFLLGAIIKLLLEMYGHLYPDAANILQNAFYVDNCCTSFETLNKAQVFEKEARDLLMHGQFDLRGWEIGRSIEERKVGVLGLIWERKEDMLSFDLAHFKKEYNTPATKRSVISFASMIFDPLGLISPITIVAKMLFKRICLDSRKFGWDTPLPPEMAKELELWKGQVLKLDEIKIPRFMAIKECSKTLWSLHTLCDASKDCYACCCYLRVEGDPVTVQLIQARARVTPSKGMTIPRAELLACLLGARLTAKIKEDIRMPDVPVTYWSDSTTAITWIKKRSVNWATWVNNRVTEIRKLTSVENWRHVPGELNPADLPSRGCTVEKFKLLRWWEGVTWLYDHPSRFPNSNPPADDNVVYLEKRKTVISAIAVNQIPSLIDSLIRLGDYHRILRVLAYLTRFVRNKYLRKVKLIPGVIPEVDTEEMKAAEDMVIMDIQQSVWKGGAPVGLKCEKDKNGIWRVVTRLVHGENSEAFQRPAVLPGNHPMVKLIIFKCHSLHSHAGVQYLQAILREKYWIINNRRTIRNVVHGCSICRVYNARHCQVQEAPLPANRINTAKCFEVTGVDLAGPLFLKNGNKVWITIFTCAVYRAVHLELVSSPSTEAFIMALKKFVARRGRPSVIYSDNGTNFHGCANLFNKVDWTQVTRLAAVQQIKWIFNPPSAAWWGGFWERLVGLMKQLLRRLLGKRVVDYAELDLLVTEVESVLNERPITYVSEDVEDLRPLTPSMFMRDIHMSFLPESEVTSAELTRRLRYLQRMKEELRQRFRSEYLGQLVSRSKGKKSDVLSPGDVVLVEYDNRKRWDWPMGVIMELYPGKDGIVRTAKVKTTQGILTRPLQRLFPLEVQKIDAVPINESLKEKNKWNLEEEASLHDEAINEGEFLDPSDAEPFITRFGRKVVKPERLGF